MEKQSASESCRTYSFFQNEAFVTCCSNNIVIRSIQKWKNKFKITLKIMPYPVLTNYVDEIFFDPMKNEKQLLF